MVSQGELDALVIAAQTGNKQALELLFEYYQSDFLRFAYKLCSDQQQAKDAVQDVWLKSVTTLSRLDDPGAFKAWMFRAIKWRVMDAFRRQKTRDQAAQTLSGLSQDHAEKPSDEFETLQFHINHLPDAEKEAIYLFYQSDLSLAEIAAIQGVPGGTVKSRLNRARNRLKDILENEDEYR